MAISADGNTAIVGGYADNGNVGAAWVFTRSGGVWSQQGTKLVGTGGDAHSWQGACVAISADGNTAIVGGPGHSLYPSVGAAWVFTRSEGVWSQQGSKLVGTDAVGAARQGTSVAISPDGNTAIVGGYADDSKIGATWVFTRSAGAWSQQGGKLVGTGAVGAAAQGNSVAASADGSTVIVGGYDDDRPSYLGAAWVFTRTGGVWLQQGSKLVGTDAVAPSLQGYSVGISSDGNTSIVGGLYDAGAGAAWVFTRSGGVWSQQGSKLVGTGVDMPALQGASMAISGDGTTALVGGYGDNYEAGAAWVFVSSATQLAFLQQPTSTTAGQPLTPAVTVQLQDGGGNPVAQAGVTITVSLPSGTGTLGGTLSEVSDTSGIATFNDLSIELVGSKRLAAVNPGRTSAVSSAFAITAGPAASIVVTGGTPQSTPIYARFAEPLRVTVTDAFGNPVAGALVAYSAPSSGSSAGLTDGGSASTDASGRASMTATANGIVGGPYLVSAAIGTLPPVRFSLTNLQGPANAIPMLGGLGLLGLALLVLTAGAIGVHKL